MDAAVLPDAAADAFGEGDAGIPTFYPPSLEEITATTGLPAGLIARRLAVIDYDQDGFVDLMTNGTRLFRGTGGGTFEEVTDAVFPDGPPSALGVFGGFADPLDDTGAVWADVDNDGDLDFFFFKRADGVDYYWDVYAGTPAVDQLWLQDAGMFRPALDALPDLTPLVGKPALTSMGAAWADYDGDGLVDLSVAVSWSNIFCCRKDDWTVIDPAETNPARRFLQTETGNADLLLHNRGGGTFEDASALLLASWYTGPYPYRLNDDTLGALQILRMAHGVSWADFDNDGDQDLYVANYRLGANQLHRNDAGSFTEVAGDLDCEGDAELYQGRTWYGHSTGAAWGDYDNDGRLDLVVCNLSHPDQPGVPFRSFSDPTQLFHNEGDRFVPETRGIEWRHRTGSPCFGDVNNDGLLDLFLGVIAIAGEAPYHSSDLYLNRGDTFELAIDSTGLGERNDLAGILADVDNDGLLDLIAGGADGRNPLGVFLNRGDPGGETDNHFLRLRLQGNGVTTNRSAIGARITVTTGSGARYIREVNAGFGSGQQGPFVQHIGLGPESGPVRVAVRWPDGRVQELDVDVDAQREIVQP